MNNIAIVGFGHVGRAMQALFPEAAVYDPYLDLGSREAVNGCDIAFLCVPTPSAPDGSCDTSAVEEVVSWIRTPITVIRSTVAPGTTDRLQKATGKTLVFQPEYYGETPNHPFADLRSRTWITLGGDREACEAVAAVYEARLPQKPEVHFVTATEAELAKYMTNAFLASKVVFCNAMYDLCDNLGADYETVRSAWLADPRIGESHTRVFPRDRGYGGSCFPKDVRALRQAMVRAGLPSDLWDGIISHNQYLTNLNEKGE